MFFLFFFFFFSSSFFPFDRKEEQTKQLFLCFLLVLPLTPTNTTFLPPPLSSPSEEIVSIRAQIEANRDETDDVKINRLVADFEKTLDEWRHPSPYISFVFFVFFFFFLFFSFFFLFFLVFFHS